MYIGTIRTRTECLEIDFEKYARPTGTCTRISHPNSFSGHRQPTHCSHVSAILHSSVQPVSPGIAAATATFAAANVMSEHAAAGAAADGPRNAGRAQRPAPPQQNRRRFKAAASRPRKVLEIEEREKIRSHLRIVMLATLSVRTSVQKTKAGEPLNLFPEVNHSVDVPEAADIADKLLADNHADLDSIHVQPRCFPTAKVTRTSLDNLRSFVEGSPKLRADIAASTPLLSAVTRLGDALHAAASQNWQRHRREASQESTSSPGGSRLSHQRKRRSGTSMASLHTSMLVQTVRILSVLVDDNRKCTKLLIENDCGVLSCIMRMFGSVRQYSATWEGMLLLSRVASVLMSIVSLDDFGRRQFFEAKGGGSTSCGH